MAFYETILSFVPLTRPNIKRLAARETFKSLEINSNRRYFLCDFAIFVCSQLYM